METPASTIPQVIQQCWNPMYLVQLSIAKKVTPKTSEYGNDARIIFIFNNLVVGASTLLRINVFSTDFDLSPDGQSDRMQKNNS